MCGFVAGWFGLLSRGNCSIEAFEENGVKGRKNVDKIRCGWLRHALVMGDNRSHNLRAMIRTWELRVRIVSILMH